MSSISSIPVVRASVGVGEKIAVGDLVVVVLFLGLGGLALLEPLAADMTATLLIGWLLIFGGLVNLFAPKGSGAIRIIVQAAISVACLIFGIYCLTHPAVAVSTAVFPYRKFAEWS